MSAIYCIDKNVNINIIDIKSFVNYSWGYIPKQAEYKFPSLSINYNYIIEYLSIFLQVVDTVQFFLLQRYMTFNKAMNITLILFKFVVNKSFL